MNTSILNIVAGIIIGSIVCLVPAIILWRMRLKSLQETLAAKQGSESQITQERLTVATNEVVHLKQKVSELEKELLGANNARSGLEASLAGTQQAIAELKTNVDTRDKKIDELNNAVSFSKERAAELQAQLESEKKQTDEKLKLLADNKEQLKTEFQNLANGIFDEKTKKFSEQNKTNLDLVLTPLRDQLGEFKKKVEDVYVNEAKERLALGEHIKILAELNQQVSRDADNLAKALKGENKSQGNWGEMILERALELSGLRKGSEYTTQEAFTDSDGNRKYPDVIVYLPEGRSIVVDSKVTLVAYENAVSAQTDQVREESLAAHLMSVRTHIEQLSNKAYDKLPDLKTLDFVLMFMPIEAAFIAAITREPALFEHAYSKKIILVSPSTLMVTLRTIHNMWSTEYQTRHTLDVAKRAADLYDKFVGFYDTLEDVRKSMGTASTKFDTAMNILKTGKGSLVSRTEHFRKLGIKPRKSLPQELLDDTDIDSGALEADDAIKTELE